MANYYTPLPAPQLQNAMLQFAPVNNALDQYREQTNQNAMLQQRQDELTYQHGRDAKQDARVAQEDQWKNVQRLGDMSLAVQNERDPARQSAMWNNAIAMHKQWFPNDPLSPEEMDVKTGPAMLSAAAGKIFDPRDSQAKDLELQYKRAQIGKLNRAGDGDFAQRAAAAQALGYDMNSDAAKSYILTGKMPREDQQALTATDKKAILEADEMTGSNRAAIQAIDEAMRLNPDANSGWLAGARASIGANLPDWLVPDSVSSPKSAQATIDFDNAVVGQALTQLKSIFGGNPTEGERKILLDLQGSSGKPKEVRQEILSRARRAAVARLQLNEQRANELRGGTYYKPGGGSAAANPASYNSAAGDPLAEARAAIAKGAPRDAVIKRLQENGVDAAGL